GAHQLRLVDGGLEDHFFGHSISSVCDRPVAAHPNREHVLRHDSDVAGEERIPDGVTRVRAPNPSAFTLDGTNTYIVERWVIDPGPNDVQHLEAVLDAAGGAI